MRNQNLKHALRTVGITPEQFADIIQVDPKTVQRWVAGTTTPYPRHRASISKALNLKESDLWPAQTSDESGESTAEGAHTRGDVTGAWGYADDRGTPDLAAFITDATGPIDLLDCCCGIEITADVTDALREQADAGRRVRILTDGQAPRWETLLDHHQIEVFLAEIPGQYWLIKTNERMLVTINLEHDPRGAPAPPLLHLNPNTEDGLFDRLATRFQQLWQLASATTDDQPHVAAITGAGQDPISAGSGTATVKPPEPDGRRWPRQPGSTR